MATSIKKSLGNSTRFIVAFDGAPTVKELLDALRNIDQADRNARLRMARSETDSCEGPRRFTFVLEAETETDIPVV